MGERTISEMFEYRDELRMREASVRRLDIQILRAVKARMDVNPKLKRMLDAPLKLEVNDLDLPFERVMFKKKETDNETK